MRFNIVNLLDTIANVNYGVWNAALINATLLSKKGVTSYAVFPDKEEFEYPGVKTFCLKNSKAILIFLKNHGLEPQNTVIVSHGSWRWPTKMGDTLKKKGYPWMVVPQGMLEPWSMQQKKLKKKVYYALFEKHLIQKADRIRAVSQPEYRRLKRVFGDKIIHIPNGITPITVPLPKASAYPLRFLFMARLHHKKGILPLVKGWLQSPLGNNPKFELTIAGPDDGELQMIKPLIDAVDNINYVGAVYGDEKEALLQLSHVYVLPSFSEGFPSSVLEAMDYGLLALISKGCNFPEAFEQKHVIGLEPDVNQISERLSEISEWSIDSIIAKGASSSAFIAAHYTNASVSAHLYTIIEELLSKK